MRRPTLDSAIALGGPSKELKWKVLGYTEETEGALGLLLHSLFGKPWKMRAWYTSASAMSAVELAATEGPLTHHLFGICLSFPHPGNCRLSSFTSPVKSSVACQQLQKHAHVTLFFFLQNAGGLMEGLIVMRCARFGGLQCRSCAGMLLSL